MLIVCPGCNTNYSIDERTISGVAAKLNCRECGTQTIVALQGTHEEASSASHASGSSTAADAAAAEAAARTADPGAGAAPQVSCPSCGHRFDPSAEAPAARAPSSARPTSAPTVPRPARAQARLLLVEDQGYFIQLTKDALGPDFEVTAVSELSGAEQALNQDRFDLVILDLSLQGNQDGRRLLKTIHKRAIPILIFTARDESEFYGAVWDELKVAGVMDILLKGVNVGEELKRKVVAIVGGKPPA